MRGNTETTIGGKTLTFDELGCMQYIHNCGSILRSLGGVLWCAAIDSLESQGLLSEVDIEKDDRAYEWANQETTDWYTDNFTEIEAFMATADEE